MQKFINTKTFFIIVCIALLASYTDSQIVVTTQVALSD